MATPISSLDLPADLAEALDEAVRRIVEVADPDVVILFGSHAEGRARADSDVDLLVVAETDEPLPLTVTLRRHARAAGLDGPLDIVVIRRSRWPHARRIRGTATWEADRYGVRLYERPA